MLKAMEVWERPPLIKQLFLVSAEGSVVEEILEEFSTHENKNKNSEKKGEVWGKAIIMHIFHSSFTVITALLIIALSLSSTTTTTPFSQSRSIF